MVLAVALPLTVFISRQPQTIEQEAAEQIDDGTIMFEIGGQSFSLADIKEVALEQYSESELSNKKVLAIAKDILIEREILDSAASELGVSATEDERRVLVETSGLSENEAFYQILREKVTLAKVRYIRAISIGYWVPPEDQRADLTPQDQERVSDQLKDGPSAITIAVNGLKAGQNPLNLSKSIISTYPSLADSLSLNGYKVKASSDEEETISESETYEYSDSNFDSETKDSLFAPSVSEGDVVRVGPNSSNGGEVVYKIIEKKNPTGAGSYSDWLKSQREGLVTKEIPL